MRASPAHLFAARPDTPVAFIEKVGGAIRLTALDAAATALGLAVGMTLADARALCPDLDVHDHDAHADRLWLERMADGCGRYTPSVALDHPCGLILDIAGCVHFFGSEKALIDDIGSRLARREIGVRIAAGNSPEAARAFARFLGASPSDEKEALKRLPVAALGLDDDATVALGRAGLKTVGEVLARPLASIAARFGGNAATMARRMTGEAQSPLTPRRILPAVGVERRFAEPIGSTDYALTILADLAREAMEALEKRHEGARRFEARLFRADGAVHRLRIETGLPTRDVPSVMRLFRERIGSLADPLDPGFGYDLIRLDIAIAERLDASQLRLEGGASPTSEVVALIDRLSTRLGRDRVRIFAACDSHIPEQAELMLPAVEARPRGHWPSPEPGEPPTRPVYMFDPPQPIDSILFATPDGPPKRFRWRRAMHEVVRAEGPERIASEWWRRRGAELPTRDYYRVEDRRGRRFWIFRYGLDAEDRPAPWYLHGLFA